MNCRNIQDELILYTGKRELPPDLQAHVNGCAACRSFWTEIISATAGLGSDSDFYLSETEIEASVSRVDERIDRLELGKVTDVRSAWKSFVPAAAAVVLLVGMSLIIYVAGWLNGDGGQTALDTPDTSFVTLENGDMGALSENDFEYILYQVSIDHLGTGSEVLFDDITEEEIEYLDQNFDVGEIL